MWSSQVEWERKIRTSADWMLQWVRPDVISEDIQKDRGGGQVWKLKRHRSSFLSGARGINCCPNCKPANWFWLFSAHFWQVRLWDKEDFPVNTEHGNKCRNINGSSSIDHGNCYFWDDFSGLERRLQGIINLLI